MSKPTTRNAPLNAYQFSLRRLFLYVHIVAVTCSAFVGVGQILTGSDNDFRVLSSAITIALASVCGLGCGAALENKTARIVPIVGLGLTLVGTVLLNLLIWSMPRWPNEVLSRAAIVVSVFAVACSHVSLLSITRLAPRFSWSFLVAVFSIFTLAALIAWPVVLNSEPSEWHVRWIAVAAIVDAMTSVLIPISHLLSRTELSAPRAGTAPLRTETIRSRTIRSRCDRDCRRAAFRCDRRRRTWCCGSNPYF